MCYKGMFHITYDYKNINCVYKVEDEHSIFRFPNLYIALQFCKTCFQQLEDSNKRNQEYAQP